MKEGQAVTTCTECGMIVNRAGEYHPYAACLMFKGCKNGATVRKNLAATVDYGMRTSEQKRSLDDGMKSLTVVRLA